MPEEALTSFIVAYAYLLLFRGSGILIEVRK